MMENRLFTSAALGHLTLRNRSIRSAAFEGMSQGNGVTDDLIGYHRAVAAGGIGMTTVAYAAVSRSGLSFDHQLWLRKEIVPDLRRLTGAIHREGAAAAIQIGHCGLMAKKSVSGGVCLAPTGRFNLYGPTWSRTLRQEEIRSIVRDFATGVSLAREAGFDAVEVHAGHGYLISQFLSTYTNRRKDAYGGSFENRCRFLREVIREVMKEAGSDMTVLVKMNMRDGFKGGMEMDESLEIARILEQEGVHALVLSCGFVCRAPMCVMHGRMPVAVMAHFVKEQWMKPFIRLFGGFLIKPEPYREAYFLEDALLVRKAVSLPLVYVGGMVSADGIGKVLSSGFDFVQIARALIHDPAFINKLKTGEVTVSGCRHANYCIAVMYSGRMACYQHQKDLPEKWKKQLDGSSGG